MLTAAKGKRKIGNKKKSYKTRLKRFAKVKLYAKHWQGKKSTEKLCNEDIPGAGKARKERLKDGFNIFMVEIRNETEE